MELGVQVLYFDSTSEVCDVCGVFDVLLEIGGDLPWRSRHSDKQEKKNMSDAEWRTAGDPTCWSMPCWLMPGKGTSSKGRAADWSEDPVVSGCATSSAS